MQLFCPFSVSTASSTRVSSRCCARGVQAQCRPPIPYLVSDERLSVVVVVVVVVVCEQNSESEKESQAKQVHRNLHFDDNIKTTTTPTSRWRAIIVVRFRSENPFIVLYAFRWLFLCLEHRLLVGLWWRRRLHRTRTPWLGEDGKGRICKGFRLEATIPRTKP